MLSEKNGDRRGTTREASTRSVRCGQRAFALTRRAASPLLNANAFVACQGCLDFDASVVVPKNDSINRHPPSLRRVFRRAGMSLLQRYYEGAKTS